MNLRPFLAVAAATIVLLPSLAHAEDVYDANVHEWDMKSVVPMSLNIPMKKRVIYTMHTRLAQIVVSFDDLMPILRTRKNAKYRDRVLTSIIPQRLRAYGQADLNLIARALMTDEYMLDLIAPLMDEGKVSLYDRVRNEYIPSFTIRDYGSKLQGVTLNWYREYLLPNGRVFYYIRLK